MSVEKADVALSRTLNWALERMRNNGYIVNSRVSLAVDPNLAIMGYLTKKGEAHYIVIADWALDSEMLGGLILHELAHIYHTEKGAPSHNTKIVEEVLDDIKRREGLTGKQIQYLVDAFNHLQNIIVDDVVFEVMNEKELKLAQRFFADWISEQPSGDPDLNVALLARNAFAIASLKRRDLYDATNKMNTRKLRFLSLYGKHAQEDFETIESFLEHARSDWSAIEFRSALVTYLDTILALMKERKQLQNLV